MRLEDFDQFPGRSRGYGGLPEEMRRRIVQDVPRWSEFIQRECERCDYPHVDTAFDFPQRLHDADAVLTTSV